MEKETGARELFPCNNCEKYKMQILWIENNRLEMICIECGFNSHINIKFMVAREKK